MPEWELDKLSSLVAKRVEDKMLAKFGKWVVLNLLGVGLVVGGGLVWVLTLSKEVDTHQLLGIQRDKRMDEIVRATDSFRAELLSKIDKINDKLDEVKLNLASHNGLATKKPPSQ